MRSRVSAGLILYRQQNGAMEVLLAHPGGPFTARKDLGYWTVPKGEIEPGEEYLVTAIREFKEEIGLEISPQSRFIELGSITQKGGKVVHAWAVEYASPEPIFCKSNTFKIEWPIGSGRWREFPEVDRAEFFTIRDARQKIKETQEPFLDRLQQQI
jgi:predicted NUDIX family NTP pyrophosphohydrolase